MVFYISRNNTISSADEYLGEYRVGSIAEGTITSYLYKTVTLPPQGDSFYSNGDDNYYIGIIVDTENEVTESNEEDNTIVHPMP